MKQNSEQDIDRILTALREAEPSANLDHRILIAIEHRTAPKSTRSWLWPLATLTTATIIFIFVLNLHHTHAPSPRPDSVSDTRTIRVPQARDGIIVANLGIVRKRDRSRPSLPTRAARAVATPQNPHPSRLLCDCDPIALAESQAPSHPAPALPLTDQEKLLRRIARHPNSVELAELNPAAREARAAQEQAAFQNFFEQSSGDQQ